jgi:hypothetical protein
VTAPVVLPSYDGARVVVAAPGPGPGSWAGAASAVLVDGTFWLAYRVRRPLGDGRGVAVVVARSDDGEAFTPVAELHRETFGAESLERPALVPRPDGGWRIYLSCATRDSKHWWVEALDADEPSGLPAGRRTVVLPGSDAEGVKDPVVLVDDRGWRMWVCVHPLSDPGHEDRMTAAYATSRDGLAWDWHGTVLRPTPGSWDARGARVTAVLTEDPLVVLYDGRPTAEDNWHEVTGVARSGDGRTLRSDGVPPLRSPDGDGAFRYVTAVPLPDGATRFYFEAARPDGAHDLMTCLVR